MRPTTNYWSDLDAAHDGRQTSEKEEEKMCMRRKIIVYYEVNAQQEEENSSISTEKNAIKKIKWNQNWKMRATWLCLKELNWKAVWDDAFTTIDDNSTWN